MALIDEAVESHDVVATKKKRWPKVVVIAVAVALIAGFVGAYVWADHYQPFVDAGYASGAVGKPMDGADAMWLHPLRTMPDEGLVSFIDAKHVGDHFWFGASLENRGRFPVQIKNVGLNDPGALPLFRTTYRWSMHDGSFSKTFLGPPYVMSGSLSLASHGAHGIQIDAVRNPCPNLGDASSASSNQPATGMRIHEVEVTYSFLWFTHTATVPISSTVLVSLGHC